MDSIYYTYGKANSNKEANIFLMNFLKKTNLDLNRSLIQAIYAAIYMYFDINTLLKIIFIYAHAQINGIKPEIITDIFEDIYIKPDFYFSWILIRRYPIDIY